MRSFVFVPVLVLLGFGVLGAQEEGLPEGLVLQGKTGRHLSAATEPVPVARPLDLARLPVAEDVRDAFVERLGEALDPAELEDRRHERIERMRRRIGMSLEEVARIKAERGWEEEQKARAAAAKPAARVEDDEDGNVWGVLIGAFVLLAWWFWRTRS